MERAIVLIDGSNLYNGLKDCYPPIERLDLEPFCKNIIQDRSLEGIYYADSNFLQHFGRPKYYPEQKKNYDLQQKYFSHIRLIKGLYFRKGYYKVWDGKAIEKKVDVYLATDLLDLCFRDKFDVAYLVSGDADLCPAVEIVVREGKRVVPVYFDTVKRNAYGLRSSCQGHFKHITKTIAEQFIWNPPSDPIVNDPIKRTETLLGGLGDLESK